jgi:hypothetical protein
METPLLIVIITATVTLLGWAVNHILAERRDRDNQRLASSLRFVERQLEELYGPLAFLILEGRRAAMDFVEALGREPVFEGKNALNEDEVKLWLLWVEDNFLPRNEAIRQLLLTKTHLIQGDTVPISFVEFLEYYNSWKMAHLRWAKYHVQYIWRPQAGWPTAFTEEVLTTFKALKANHNRIATRIYE